MEKTFYHKKDSSVEYVLSVLNSFHKNIKVTYEEEQNNTLPFLDVLSKTSFQENINESKSSEYDPDTLEQSTEKMYSLILPYAGPKGNTIIFKTMNNSLKRILPDNVKTRVIYTGQKK